MYLASEAGGLSDVKLQPLIVTSRNRTIHTCDLNSVCNVLEINIELISLRDDGANRVQHYTDPCIDFEGPYKSGLIDSRYCMNDTINVTS